VTRSAGPRGAPPSADADHERPPLPAAVGSRERAGGGRSCSVHAALPDGAQVSWDEAFADGYDVWSAHMTADIPFYVGLALEADGPIVELAVGTGRVAVPVARATGRRVIGLDASPAMLRQAREQAGRAGVELTLIEGDMRDLEVDEPAALVYCPFRALLHLRTWADRRRVFERVAGSLRPGGRFAWNAFAFDHRVATRLDGLRHEAPVPHTVRYAVGDDRIDLVLDDGATASLWWATKNEWLGLLDVAGLQLEALYGGFEREPVSDDSTEYVFVARR
jgi:ubiquinone/menaquinone biosynthesis C-methylase UbiE